MHMHTHVHADQQPAAHSHDVPLEVALDFVNTRELTRTGFIDYLPDLATALGWLRDHGLLHDEAADRLQSAHADEPDSQAKVLRRVRRLRGALREVLDATVERRLPSPEALEQVNRALRARDVQQLVAAGDGVSLDHRHEGDPVDEALSRLAQAIAREVAAADAGRLRICANDECRWVFKDDSPSGRRKWCSMAVCGNRAKVARHRARRKVNTESAPSSRAPNRVGGTDGPTAGRPPGR